MYKLQKQHVDNNIGRYIYIEIKKIQILFVFKDNFMIEQCNLRVELQCRLLGVIA